MKLENFLRSVPQYNKEISNVSKPLTEAINITTSSKKCNDALKDYMCDCWTIAVGELQNYLKSIDVNVGDRNVNKILQDGLQHEHREIRRNGLSRNASILAGEDYNFYEDDVASGCASLCESVLLSIGMKKQEAENKRSDAYKAVLKVFDKIRFG